MNEIGKNFEIRKFLNIISSPNQDLNVLSIQLKKKLFVTSYLQASIPLNEWDTKKFLPLLIII